MDFGPGATGRLVGSEIHGFHTMQDLDVRNIMEDSRSRWLRPNEIHAMLCNYKYFTINVKPVHLPKSGTIVLFDRKMLRNFRKDGHNWKKKNDGKTVKEAHEHLKVGNEERIHVYYAHGQDNPTFVRRCYWLLDKALEHIVLVHYRETQELQASPVAPVNSNPSSVTDQSAPWLLSEDLDSGAACAHYGGMEELIVSTGPGACLTATNHEMRIHEINTLEWDELVANDPNNLTVPSGDKVLHFRQENQIPASGSLNDGSCLPAYSLTPAISPMGDFTQPIISSDTSHLSIPDSMYNFQTTGIQVNSNMPWKDSNAYCTGDSLDVTVNDGLHSQDSFGRWMNHIIADSPGSVDTALESSISSANGSFTSTVDQHQSSVPEQIFTIMDFSPAWGFSTETTKILVTGYFHYQYAHLSKSNLSCICGDACVPALIVQPGVYKCSISPHSPGLVSLCLSVDGHKPISQILNFEYRCPPMLEPVASSDDKPMWQEFQLQMRLAHLLFSTSKKLNILTSKVSPSSLKEAKRFADKTSALLNSWIYLMKSIGDDRISFAQAKDSLFELTLKQLLKEWLLERVLEGRKTTPYDSQGQGVIHLCAILGYSWAIRLFSWSGLSLDFRDKHGWTALHWAAYYGREKMVAVLLSEGAKANLVTDPTKENPGGCTASDLAAVHGFEGLAGYLSEKALVAHFEAMSIAGNASGSLQSNATEAVNSENLSEEEMNLKDTLAAYRTAADAAARIQAAFREHSLKVRTTAVEFSNPEEEARNIVAAMKIQHAFRNFESRKKMAAAVRIQYRFRTWKMRKEFLRMRNQAIKIQAAFRGLLVRRQYRKIMWSVGVLEKAVLRWRLKRRGFRGLHVEHAEPVVEPSQESDTEEDFFRTSRLQAEERVERSVVRVQAMFRSKKAQEEYRRMKLTYNQAMLEGEELRKPDMDTDR